MKLFMPLNAKYDEFSELCASVPQLLESVTDDQSDLDLQSAELVPIFSWNTDKPLLGLEDQVVNPTTLSVHGRPFSNLYKQGAFIVKVDKALDSIAGLHQINPFVYVMPCPTRPFEKMPETKVLAKAFFMDCLWHMAPFGHKINPIILVLGRQHDDGNHENLEFYLEHNASFVRKMGNVSEYSMAVAQGKFSASITIFHANLYGFQNQHLDSPELNQFFQIYRLSSQSNRPIIIHCKDGMDRTGAVSFAYRVLSRWDDLFSRNELDAHERRKSMSDQLTKNQLLTMAQRIMAEHATIQDLRGPGFCVASKSLLRGAVQLAFILKAIELSQELCSEDEVLTQDYMKMLFSLERRKSQSGGLSTNDHSLLTMLRNRASLESAYFDELALDEKHIPITYWNIDQLLHAGDSELKSTFSDKFNLLLNDYLKGEKVSEDALSGLYAEIQIQSTLVKIREIKNAVAASHNQPSLDDTKVAEILKSSATKNEKFNKLSGILLNLQITPLFQRLEKLLLDSRLADADRDKKRSEFINNLKNPIEMHLKSIATLGVDKRRLLQSYILKLKEFEKSLENIMELAMSPSRSRRRGLSSPPPVGRSQLESTSPRGSSRATDTSDSQASNQISAFLQRLSPKLSRASKKVPELSLSDSTPDEAAPLSPSRRGSIFSKKVDTSPRYSSKVGHDAAAQNDLSKSSNSFTTPSGRPQSQSIKDKLKSEQIKPSSDEPDDKDSFLALFK